MSPKHASAIAYLLLALILAGLFLIWSLSLADVENMRVRLPDGTEIPFKTIAEVRYGRGYSTIRRVDRRRVVSVSADVDEAVASAGKINAELRKAVLPRLMNEFQGLKIEEIRF